ncbi:MAG: hypothetical protein PUB67_05490 [Clostridiales bacterium]|nr:hypothetical protein [Clostridiales bacterium]
MLYTGKNKNIVLLLLLCALLLVGCGAKDASAGTDGSADKEKNNEPEKQEYVVKDFGTEKDIFGYYADDGKSGLGLALTYDSYSDRYMFTLHGALHYFTVCTGTYSYAEGTITLIEIDEGDAQKNAKIVLMTDENKKLILDASKSTDWDRIAKDILHIENDKKDSLIFDFSKELIPEMLDKNDNKVNKPDLSDCTVKSLGSEEDIQGIYELSEKTVAAAEKMIPGFGKMANIELGNEGGKNVFSITGKVTIKGEYTYVEGLLTLSFEDNDTNFGASKTRYLYFYSNEEGNFVLLDKASDVDNVPTGIPFFVDVEYVKK